jgi:ribosomal protein L44E
MTQHFTRSTVSASHWCSKCQKHTQHRVDDRRIGPCLDCIARLTVESAQHEIDRRRAAKHPAPKQSSLFSELSA